MDLSGSRPPPASATLLLFAISLLRLLIPSLALLVLLCQAVASLLRRLFFRLQQSSFGESSSSNGYQRISEDSDGAAQEDRTRRGVSLPPDANGILPVVVPVTALRPFLIYGFFSLSILTYLFSAGILIAHSILEGTWEPQISAPFLLYHYEEYYLIGTSIALSSQLLYLAWRDRSFGETGKGIEGKRAGAVTMLLLVTGGEIALLAVWTRVVQILGVGRDRYVIAHLVVLGIRILFLLLAVAAFTPLLARKTFEPNEYSRLNGETAAGSQQVPNGNSSNGGYGTFANGTATKTPQQAQGAAEGTAENGGTAKSPITPEYKKSFWARIKVLSPYLWPKKSKTLQAVACKVLSLLQTFSTLYGLDSRVASTG